MWLTACSRSVASLVDDLETGGEVGARAATELLLLKTDAAVEPLLAALSDPARSRAHVPAVGVLIRAIGKLEDDRLQSGLEHHLKTHADPEVRAGIARGLGVRQRYRYADALLAAVQDTVPDVRYAMYQALVQLWSKLETGQQEEVDALARKWATTDHEGLREEIEIRLQGQVNTLLRSANQLVVEARIDEARQSFEEAAALLPNSWKTRFSLARFHLDNGDAQLGFDSLDELGAVLHVPRAREAPRIDGRLDESFWETAGQEPMAVKGYRGFFEEAEIETRTFVAYTDDALYVGVHSTDDSPADLEATRTTRDDQVWMEDSIELFFDSNADRHSYLQVIVSARGTLFDATQTDGLATQVRDWNGDYRVATHVGEDFWSMEARLAYDGTWLKRPRPGDRWVANFCRNFRDRSQSMQWVYTGGDFHRLADFGFLLFQ